MQFYEVNICRVMIFRLFAVYNKHKMIKIGGQTREKSQVLSKVLEYFCCRLLSRDVISSNTNQDLRCLTFGFLMLI